MDWTDKPFHESIVDAIAEATTPEDFAMLARMIQTTKIPNGHQVIIEAWRGSKIDERHPDRMVIIACLLGKKAQAKMDEEKDHVKVGGATVIVD